MRLSTLKLSFFVIISLTMWADGGGWDYLYGEWQEKQIPPESGIRTIVTFENTRITIKGPKGEEVWTVVEGDNLLQGLVVEREGIREMTSSMVKFNEMGFRLGKRHWLLRKAGTEDNQIPVGGTINGPPINSDGPDSEKYSIAIDTEKQPKTKREQTAGENASRPTP